MREQQDFDALEYTFQESDDTQTASAVLPEESLWSAVIHLALEDARQGSRSAREWLLFEREDFITVCTLAGFSPRTIRTAARRMLQFSSR